MNTKTIRHFGLSLFAGLVMTACGGSDPKPADKPAASEPAKTETAAAPAKLTGAVNVYNWVEYIPENMKANFEKATGLKVNYDTFEVVSQFEI